MPKSLADGKRKAAMLASTPADVDAITATEANGGTDISDYVLTTSVIGPSGSDTIDEKVFSSRGNAKAWGPSNFEGNFLVIHRYYDASDEQPDPSADATWTALKSKDTTLRLLWRLSAKDAGEDFEDGDEYRYVEFTTDDPQDESGEGYQKYRIPLAYSGVSALDQEISSGS